MTIISGNAFLSKIRIGLQFKLHVFLSVYWSIYFPDYQIDIIEI